MLQDILNETKQDMTKAIESFKKAMMKVRTGRASINIFDGVIVDYYGSPTPLNQLATLSAPEPRLLTIQPWDKGALDPIEKALFKSDLGLTPANDGTIIRVPVPPLTEERRREIVKKVKQASEDYKVEVRNHRRSANATLKELEKEKEINQDDLKKAQDKVQEYTDESIKRIDALLASKEKEIMEV